MKRFLNRSIIFTIPIVLFFVIFSGQAGGYTDPFYVRFTTPKQDNLILGTSRAAQGLQPDIFKKILKKNIYNYAFTVGHSPFGPTYLNSIKKKLSKNGENNVFVVAVDPWSISSTSENPNDSLNFREVGRCLGNTQIVNMKPNYLYILNNLNLRSDFDKILNNENSSMFLHENGWLEISVNIDSTSFNQRINKKIETYTEVNLPRFNFSTLRLEYLKRTITFLNQYGQVFLVRLPVHEKMVTIEKN